MMMFEIIIITVLAILFIQVWCDTKNETIFEPFVSYEYFDVDYDKSIEKTFIGVFDNLSQCPKDCAENSMVDILEIGPDTNTCTCTIYIYTAGEWHKYSRSIT